ncbi:MAG: hypothetical protein WC533_00125 [Candidatus Pacearchaeota archaeon]
MDKNLLYLTEGENYVFPDRRIAKFRGVRWLTDGYVYSIFTIRANGQTGVYLVSGAQVEDSKIFGDVTNARRMHFYDILKKQLGIE